MLSKNIDDLNRKKRKYEKYGSYSTKIPKRSAWYGDVKDLMMSLKAYQTWISKSSRDARITYYRGYMVEPSIQPIAPTQDRKRVEKLQTAVYDSYLANLVTLVQRRHGRFDYEYIAVRK